MKKYLSIIFVVILLFLTISPCLATEIEEMNVEVSEKEKKELIEFIKQYNELILLGYMCEGSFEYDDSVAYGLNEDYLPSKTEGILTTNDYRFKDQRYIPEIAEFVNQQYDIYSNVGYLVTDRRFQSYEDLYDLVFQVFLEWGATTYPFGYYNSRCFDIFFEFFGNTPFFQKYALNYGESAYSSPLLPSFRVDENGKMYTAKPINSYATLYYRYIDIDSIEICADYEYFYVFARGSSEFRDGKVSAPDSDVRMKIFRKRPDVDNKFIIETINAKRDHITYPDLSVMSNDELARYMIGQYNALNTELLKVDKSKVYKLDNLNVKTLGLENNNYYKVESDIFRSIVDVYDWINELMYPNEKHFYNLYFGGGFYEICSEDGIGTDVWAIHFPYLADSEYGLFLSETALEHGFLEIPISNSFRDNIQISKSIYFDNTYVISSVKEEGKIDSLEFYGLTHDWSGRYFCWSADTWMTDLMDKHLTFDRKEGKWVKDNVNRFKLYDFYLLHGVYNTKIDGIFGGGLHVSKFAELYYELIDTKYIFPITNTK